MAMRNVSQAEIASVLDSVSEVKYFWKLRAPLRKRLDKIGVNFVGAMGVSGFVFYALTLTSGESTAIPVLLSVRLVNA